MLVVVIRADGDKRMERRNQLKYVGGKIRRGLVTHWMLLN